LKQKPWCYIEVHPAHKAKIDREDLARVSEHKWRITTGTTGRIRVVTSIRKGAQVRNVTLGRFLMDPPRTKQVYPRRFNESLDYRKDNLLICTLRERQRLLPKNRKKTSSSYRGVSKSAATGKWRAAIEVDGHAMNLGDFASEQKAAAAYNRAARAHFGKDAYQNQIGRRIEKRN
jgi:AP2-like factor (euAP2 lineage)